MANSYFRFRQFTIRQEKALFKVGTDGVLLGALSDLDRAASVLDVGTGTGLIAIMTAQRAPGARITAIEPHKPSALQAEENVRSSPWPERIEVIPASLSEYMLLKPPSFSLIISNPPFFRDSLLNPDFEKSSSRHTWSLSPVEIIEAALRLLQPDGSLQIILPYEEGMLFIAEAAVAGLFCTRMIKVKPNNAAKIRRVILKFERSRKLLHESFFTIETGGRHKYSEEYAEATRDFYLNL